MARKKGGGADLRRRGKGVPNRARAEKERREIEAKEHVLRSVCATLQTLASDLNEPTGTSSTALDAATAAAFQEVRQLALAPRGFVSDTFRQRIWTFLVGCSDVALLETHDPNHFVTRCTGPHRDDSQLEKDIDRSLWHYDIVRGIRASERRVKRRALTHVINAVLRTNDELHYYQGFHDVCSVFLLTLSEQRAFEVVTRVCATYQREPMRNGFETVMHATRLLFPLLQAEDEPLHAYMRASGVEPFFALPWLITWFAHQLVRFEDVARLYDVLLVSHPLFCLYLSAAVVLEARTRVLQCDCDFGAMHSLLSKLPLSMDVERVIARAALLLHLVPPSDLLLLADDATASAIQHSSYMQFPFAFQQRFGVERPYVRVAPALLKKKQQQHAKATSSSICRSFKTSFLVRAAAVGVIAAIASYAYRSRVQPV